MPRLALALSLALLLPPAGWASAPTVTTAADPTRPNAARLIQTLRAKLSWVRESRVAPEATRKLEQTLRALEWAYVNHLRCPLKVR